MHYLENLRILIELVKNFSLKITSIYSKIIWKVSYKLIPIIGDKRLNIEVVEDLLEIIKNKKGAVANW